MDRRRADVQRRIARVGRVLDVGPELAQGVDEVADRPLVHARHAGQAVVAAAQRQGRGQRAEGRAGIAEEELGALDREGAAGAGQAPGVTAQRRHRHAERAQGFMHARGIVGFEQVADLGVAPGQRGEQQHPVGNALRAGQADAAPRGQQFRQVDRFRRTHLDLLPSQARRAARATSKVFSSTAPSPRESASCSSSSCSW